MPSTAVRGTYAISPDTGNAARVPPWPASLDQFDVFEDVELTHLQKRLPDDPAFAAAMKRAEATILRAFEGDAPQDNGVSAHRRGVAANDPHDKRGEEITDSREVTRRRLATLLATPVPDGGKGCRRRQTANQKTQAPPFLRRNHPPRRGSSRTPCVLRRHPSQSTQATVERPASTFYQKNLPRQPCVPTWFQ